MHSIKSALGLLASAAVTTLAGADLAEERNVGGIMDNSFLVEEAYNQEKGVVQHILTGRYSRQWRSGADNEFWDFSFTQEWPILSQAHQLSYTVPFGISRIEGNTWDGLGDILLNYRYQAFFDPETLTAFAPRASLILPTGDEDSGLGEDTLGIQLNLPFSTTLGDRWFLHANAGSTFLPDAASAQERDLLHFNLGGSAIYAPTRDLHFLVEWVGYWTEERSPSSRYEFGSLISPGVRKAINFDNGSQLVIGMALPVGLTSGDPDLGVFLYASFEHFFSQKR